mmetsp:Transcript_7124/g.18247  ORF Transcript_7124/g.18247 Transcript_7124/m.18247 type:complete len:211 (-) Transcript_7124:40-672(-)
MAAFRLVALLSSLASTTRWNPSSRSSPKMRRWRRWQPAAARRRATTAAAAQQVAAREACSTTLPAATTTTSQAATTTTLLEGCTTTPPRSAGTTMTQRRAVTGSMCCPRRQPWPQLPPAGPLRPQPRRTRRLATSMSTSSRKRSARLARACSSSQPAPRLHLRPRPLLTCLEGMATHLRHPCPRQCSLAPGRRPSSSRSPRATGARPPRV